VNFLSGTKEKQLGLPVVIANGLIKCNKPGFDEKSKEYKLILSKAQTIANSLEYAAKALEPYEKYLQK
jgi:hypothetical protein